VSIPSVKCTWHIAEYDRPRTRALAQAAGIPPIVAHILLLRGIATSAQVQRFLYPALSHLSDPFLLSGMRPAVARIAEARERGEHVLIFGDYDVDGIAATAILVNAFKRFGLEHFSHDMPQRLTEGYGLSADRVEAAAHDGVHLIVTVDNGISAHEAAQRARELGLGLIITDHHSIENGLPEAHAVINPKREDRSYPGYHLCGAGVAFKLAEALNGTKNDLDIAALGTVADIVPLCGENRAIVSLGLRHMVKHQRTGLAQLAAAAGFELSDVTSERIGFQLGPRLNAAGRLAEGLTALELLLAECPIAAGKMARQLDAANEERRAIERVMFNEAAEELDAFLSPELQGIVVARRGWHAGVVGIVASRLQGRYHRPVVMIAIDDEGIGRGSGRAGAGFDLVGALGTCHEHLVKFGGHRAAAGLTIRSEDIEAFRAAFQAEALRQLGPGERRAGLAIDVLASFSEIDNALLAALKRLEPIGHQNPAPLFCSLGVTLLPQSLRVLKDQHLKMSVRQGATVFPAIGFNMAERFFTQDVPREVDIAYTPQFNTWRGETSIQLLLKDIRPAGPGP